MVVFWLPFKMTMRIFLHLWQDKIVHIEKASVLLLTETLNYSKWTNQMNPFSTPKDNSDI